MEKQTSSREKEIYKVTLWGSLVNFLLLVFKFVAGIVGHSSAMIADAVHSLSDFATDIIVIAFVRISGKMTAMITDTANMRHSPPQSSGLYCCLWAWEYLQAPQEQYLPSGRESSLRLPACWPWRQP